MRLSSLFMKNPIERLSGDQNGRRAPSVPGRARAFAESRSRTHSIGCPSRSATNASRRPSGDIAKDAGSAVRGVVISTTRNSGAFSGRRRNHAVSMATSASASSAVDRPSTRALRRFAAASSAAAFPSGSSIASSSSMRTSAM